jgi:hypothetical protein
LRVGFDPKDLLPRRPESFTHSFDRKRKLSPEERAVKYAHFESRRKEKIAIVREERERLIRESANDDQKLVSVVVDNLQAHALPFTMMTQPGCPCLQLFIHWSVYFDGLSS